MSRDTRLQEILDKQQIREVLLRYCRGVDRRDERLLRSVYHPEAVHEHGGQRTNGWEFAKRIVDAIGRYTVTSHFLTNESIELDGCSAHVESYVLAVHRSEHKGKKTELTLALRYIDRFEQRSGSWKIVQRTAIHDWSREQKIESEWTDAATMLQGRRDGEDWSYKR